MAKRFDKIVVAAVAVLIAVSAASAQDVATYRYDALGRLVKVFYPDGSSKSVDVSYEFDTRGNRTERKVAAGTGANRAPVAVDDSFALEFVASEGGFTSMRTCANPLANDTDLDGDTLSISAGWDDGYDIPGCYYVIVEDAEASGYSANIAYTVSDGHGGTDTGSVHIAF